MAALLLQGGAAKDAAMGVSWGRVTRRAGRVQSRHTLVHTFLINIEHPAHLRCPQEPQPPLRGNSSPTSTTRAWAASCRGPGTPSATLLTGTASLLPLSQAGTTPLLAAAMEGHLEVVRELLAAGASTELVNEVR